MKQALTLLALIAAAPALAENTRQLEAHEHGVGALNIAIEETTVTMGFHAPGADIVGFEYAAESEADHAAIDAALATLSAPLELFILPDAASCTVADAHAALENEDHHGDHDKDHHDEHSDENHDDHTDGKHTEEDHAEHDNHAQEEHAEHDEASGHTEFHAEYTLTCETPAALSEINFAYFEIFPNAQEVEVQIVTSSGAKVYEVKRGAPVLNMGQ
ncbi:zinc uptake protein ZrgA [Phaeobacter porticola]|uniref:ABC-type Zn2+ transport system, periplasmic component/surface adhesin n=1 Tax=Phaeobacter porticola TaxID=1844006 RepID=A0A1L3I1U1_9RHOB|nr:DUF2796 domain-containing protein [Phaeobacter porticola]APG46093.1 ABC-type Zn2+ transport system, periplasmic component/surface adhesin [Phaeobacter porticola]